MHGTELVYAIQKERLTRHKHHWGKLGDLLRQNERNLCCNSSTPENSPVQFIHCETMLGIAA